ncbi:ferritin light chain-like [Diabrotica undecimpunctata]|uniref:ferritin light chain-like n=1 Tax=Diabrotica undecimpunctata TaxID=50387 RepID=UPI003B63C4D6
MPGIMKTFIVLSFLCVAALASEDFCYQDAVTACNPTAAKYVDKLNCTAKFGAIDAVESDLQKFINHHFIRSFEYLLLATNFATYERNRAGFEKLFRGLSDNKWHEGIEFIKYLTSRGGQMNFNAISKDIKSEEAESRSFDLRELTAIAKALDIEKKFVHEAHSIHREATRNNKQFHDPEISDYLEKEVVHKERDLIRKLAGYSTDLAGLLNGPDSSLALYMFDDYLQKQ